MLYYTDTEWYYINIKKTLRAWDTTRLKPPVSPQPSSPFFATPEVSIRRYGITSTFKC